MTRAGLCVRLVLAAAGLVINTFALAADAWLGRWRMAGLVMVCVLINIAVLTRSARRIRGQQ